MIYQRRNRNQCWCTGVSHAVSNIATPKFQCFSIICLIRFAMLGYLLSQIRLKLAANLLKCEHEDLSTTLRDPRVLEELLCRKLWRTVVMFSPDWEDWLDLVNVQAFQSFPIPPVNVCFPTSQFLFDCDFAFRHVESGPQMKLILHATRG